MTTASKHLIEGLFTARFHDPNVQAGAAHTLTFSMPPEGTVFTPFKCQDFDFLVTTAKMVEEDGDTAFNNDRNALRSPTLSRSSSFVEEPPAKRSCIRKDKKTIPTRLNIMRPVKIAKRVAQDAWRIIFERTTPAFLLEARTICQGWNTLLKEDAIWRRARVEESGPDSPGPPKGMSERKFADLLAGKGCQNRSCPKVNTTKVFWAFRTRMCDDCFKERTVKEDAAGRLFGPLVEQYNLLELLPAGVIRSGKYKGTRQWQPESESWVEGSTNLLYLSMDVKNIASECASRIANGSTVGDTDTWRALKIQESQELMKQTAAIEEWLRKRDLEAPDIRGARKEFFENKAMELSPPMPREVLHKMQAYHAAISSRRPPSEKCWISLKSKILKYRGEAERLVAYQLQADSFPEELREIYNYRKLHEHRFGHGRGRKELHAEQEYVVQVAKEELQKCLNRTPPVADEDLVLLCLRNVFERYNMVPRHDRVWGPGTDVNDFGPYVLTLDDAKMIVEEIFEPAFGDDPHRNRAVLEGFRCKGCSRQDCTRKYRFVEVFKHIHQKHASRVGEGYHFSYFGRPFLPYVESAMRFPWYTTEWPRNLPIAASHQEVNSDEVWTPDDAVEYIEMSRPSVVSAFVDRVAHKTDLEYDDFVGNLAHAAGKLTNTALEKELQTKIFLQYALDLWQRSLDFVPVSDDHHQSRIYTKPRLTLEQFVDAMTELRRLNPSLSLRYRCGACVKARGAAKGARFVKNPVDFHALLEHWSKKHTNLDWRTNLMDLPDEREVLGQIKKVDAELQQTKADIRAREEAKTKNPRKKGNAKASVVLAMYNGMDVFEQLFNKRV
jgi:hypothetical protein